MLTSAMDHLVVTAPTLSAGVQYVEQTLGCSMQPGGQHARMGTHNALLRISEQCYLEVIAVDPHSAPAGRARWFELDSLRPDDRPRLATWVVRASNIRLTGCHPEARLINSLLARIGFVGDVSIAEPSDGITVSLAATFQTRPGIVVLS